MARTKGTTTFSDGQMLAALIEAKGNRSAAAKALGLTPQAVSYWARDKKLADLPVPTGQYQEFATRVMGLLNADGTLSESEPGD